MESKKVTVAVGDGVVSVKREGSSATTVAHILGRIERDGVETICLDRLVHMPFEDSFVGWSVRGAVTTLLSRPVESTQA